MSVQDCLAKGRKSFEHEKADQFGHAGAWVTAIYFFVAGVEHLQEALTVLQYAMDRKKLWDMNKIVPDKPKEAAQIRDTLRRYASIIPAILIAFKKDLAKIELPITETALHELFLTACFQVGIQDKYLDGSALPPGDTTKRRREVKHMARILARYFLAHPIILKDALDLLMKNEKPAVEEPEEVAEVDE